MFHVEHFSTANQRSRIPKMGKWLHMGPLPPVPCTPQRDPFPHDARAVLV